MYENKHFMIFHHTISSPDNKYSGGKMFPLSPSSNIFCFECSLPHPFLLHAGSRLMVVEQLLAIRRKHWNQYCGCGVPVATTGKFSY